MNRHYFRLKKLNGKKLKEVKSFFVVVVCFFMIKPLLANHHVWGSSDFHERIPSISFSLQKCKDQKCWECSHSQRAVATFHISALEQHTGSWIMTFSGFVINMYTVVLISCFFLKRCFCFIFVMDLCTWMCSGRMEVSDLLELECHMAVSLLI